MPCIRCSGNSGHSAWRSFRSGTEAIKVGGLGGTGVGWDHCLVAQPVSARSVYGSRLAINHQLLGCTSDVFTSSKLQAAPRFLAGNPQHQVGSRPPGRRLCPPPPHAPDQGFTQGLSLGVWDCCRVSNNRRRTHSCLGKHCNPRGEAAPTAMHR